MTTSPSLIAGKLGPKMPDDINFGSSGVIIPNTTFDPSLGNQCNYSNGNLSASYLITSTRGAGIFNPKSAGKFYFELTCDNVTNGIEFGMVSSTWSYNGPNQFATQTANYGLDKLGQYGNLNTTMVPLMGPISNGENWGIAVDIGSGKIWFRKNGGNWNNNVSGDPVAAVLPQLLTGVGAYVFAVELFNSAVTMNFGATAFANAAPTGYGKWPMTG